MILLRKPKIFTTYSTPPGPLSKIPSPVNFFYWLSYRLIGTKNKLLNLVRKIEFWKTEDWEKLLRNELTAVQIAAIKHV